MRKQLRIWKLGDLEQKLFPTPEAVEKLSKLLEEGKTDIIWGPDIQVLTVEEPVQMSTYYVESEAIEFLQSHGYTVTKNE